VSRSASHWPVGRPRLTKPATTTADEISGLDSIRETYTFDVSCQGSVPQSIIAFLEATDFEDAIRNAISLGGDVDTMACIAGGIAEAYYGVPSEIEERTLELLDDRLRAVVQEFNQRFRGQTP